MWIKVYGCRGSVTAPRPENSLYGGNTSCFLIESGGCFLIVDAGSGLFTLGADLASGRLKNMRAPLNLLLSHLHFDHISGLAMFSPVFSGEPSLRVHTCHRGAPPLKPLKEQVFGAFSPPYWPVALKDVATAECVPISADAPFALGRFTVTPFAAAHSDGALSFHISDGRASVVYLLDSELAGNGAPEAARLLKYCGGADLVIFDASYAHADYEANYRGWGHSTVREGVLRAREWRCGHMLFAHFSPRYSDGEIDAWASEFNGAGKFILARDNMELYI